MYTQIRIKEEYRDKLRELAQYQNRSMANMVEVLIDEAMPSRKDHTIGSIFDPDYLKDSLDKLTIRKK